MNDFEISQNNGFCCHLLQHFLKNFYEEKENCDGLLLHLFFPVLPIVLNTEFAESISTKLLTANKASFYKAVNENTLFVAKLQESMEAYYQKTLQSLSLGFRTGLFSYDKNLSKVVLLKSSNIVPIPKLSLEYQKKLAACKRLGVWFAQSTEEEIFTYLNIVF